MVRRNAVRLVVLDANDRVLLLHVRDLSNPQFGTIWELPGGGIEEGETYVRAAMRELQEETGLHVQADTVSAPTWRRQVSYTYRGTQWEQHEIVVSVRVSENTPAISIAQREGVEKEDVFGAHWWPIEQIVAVQGRFYPRSLPVLLPRFMRGESIEEEPERWT